MAKIIAAANRKAKKKSAPPAPPPEIDDDDDDDDLDLGTPATIDAETELAHVLAELGGLSDATITVTKVSTQGEERLGKYMAREFDVDGLRDRYGGGVYWLYAHAGGVLKTKKRVVFARSIEEQRGELRPAASSSGGGDTSLKDALAELARQQREMLQLVLSTVTQNRPPALDAMQVIDAATKLASLGGGNKGNDIDVLLQGIKLAKEFGRDAGEPGLPGLAMEFLQTMRSSMSHQPQHQLTGPTEGSPEQMMFLIQRALAQQLPMLIRGAQSETDPSVYAQLILDQLPQAYLPSLLEQLHKPDWFALLVRVDGRVVPLQAWFAALRNEIVQATSPKDPAVG